MTQEELMKKAFIAGRNTRLDFEEWISHHWLITKDDKSKLVISSIAKVINDVGKQIFWAHPEEFLNRRRLADVEAKVIIRGCLYNEIPYELGLVEVADIEHKAGAKKPPHHSTIIHSLEEYKKIKDQHHIKQKVTKLKNEISNYIKNNYDSLI